MKNDKVYDIITDRIIEQLEKGTIPWHKPWKAGHESLAMNFVSKNAYKGINSIMTNFQDYDSPYWATFLQIKKAGGTVTKGQKSTPVIFWKFLEKENKDGEVDKIPMLKYFNIFNLDQTTGIDYEKPSEELKTPFEQIQTCTEVLYNKPPGMPRVEHVENRAYYAPKRDIINMPKKEAFDSEQSYYAVLFHEMIHSTGHEIRLNRDGIVDNKHFGSETYCKEELVAEFGACFLNGHSGILNHTLDNSTAYIQGWLKQLKKDNKLVISAASKAQKAADYILNNKE